MKAQSVIPLISSGKAIPTKLPSYLKALVPERLLQEQAVEITAAEEILFQKQNEKSVLKKKQV